MTEIDSTYNYYLKLSFVKKNSYTKNDYFDISDDGQLYISFTDHCCLYDMNCYKIYQKDVLGIGMFPYSLFKRDIIIGEFTCHKRELFEKVKIVLKKSIRNQKLKNLI